LRFAGPASRGVSATSDPEEPQVDPIAKHRGMCGRYGLFTRPWGIAKRLGASADASLPFVPRYNIAPTQPVLAITNDEARSLVDLRWGLVPRWATSPADVKLSTFNARIETIATAPAYRDSTRERRCVILADGFYEWRKNANGSKTPRWIHRIDGEPFVFAGLWDVWRRGDEHLASCTVITTAANDFLRDTHSRMPVVLDDELAREWLTAETLDPKAALAMLVPSESAATWTMRAVSARVGNVRNDDPALIQPAAEFQASLF
jgi:putative SOS response-associated peptidase YedK